MGHVWQNHQGPQSSETRPRLPTCTVHFAATAPRKADSGALGGCWTPHETASPHRLTWLLPLAPQAVTQALPFPGQSPCVLRAVASLLRSHTHPPPGFRGADSQPSSYLFSDPWCSWGWRICALSCELRGPQRCLASLSLTTRVQMCTDPPTPGRSLGQEEDNSVFQKNTYIAQVPMATTSGKPTHAWAKPPPRGSKPPRVLMALGLGRQQEDRV